MASGIHAQMITLTRWLAHNLTFATHGCEFDHNAKIGWWPLGLILSSLFDGEMATMCGGAAALLRAKARQQGIEAFAFNFGQPGTINTHVIGGAKLENGRYAFYCPTFGLTLLDRTTNEPASLDLICASLATRDLRRLRTARLTPSHMRFRADAKGVAYLRQMGGLAVALPTGPDRFRCIVHRHHYAAGFARRCLPWIAAQVPEPSIFDLLRFPLSHSGDAEAEDIVRRLRGMTP